MSELVVGDQVERGIYENSQDFSWSNLTAYDVFLKVRNVGEGEDFRRNINLWNQFQTRYHSDGFRYAS